MAHPSTGVEPYKLLNIADVGDAPVNRMKLDASIQMITDFLAKLRALEIRPVTIGGDHMIPTPILRALAAGGQVGLLQIDNHADVPVQDVLSQAEERQKNTPGMQFIGAVLQHFVGAKLDCALGAGQFDHNSVSTSDARSGPSGDFLVGGVALHVATSPGEGVVQRCTDNLDDGFRPVIVTTARGLILLKSVHTA